MKRISQHISYPEAVHSYTAKRLHIDNTPNELQLAAMRNVANKVFEPLREFVGGPVKINSFFRSYELNKAIGGTRNSQHMTGEAIDIDDTYGYATNSEMFHFIKDNLDFDQLIWEFGDDNNPAWIHVSYKLNGRNRQQVLKAVRRFGHTKYILYED